MILVENISHQYKAKKVLEDLSLEITQYHFTCLLGNTGSGKSTLLRIIAGLEKPSAGKVWLRGRLVTDRHHLLVPPEKRNIGYIFQDLALWPHFSVFDNVAFGLKVRKVKDRQNKVKRMLDYFNLHDHASKYPHQLSGGQQQLVALARSLVLEPDILLLDEPLSNLDVQLRQLMMEHLLRLKEQENITFIYVTHDPREASQLADDLVVLGNHGKVAYTGSWEAVKTCEDSFVQSLLKAM